GSSAAAAPPSVMNRIAAPARLERARYMGSPLLWFLRSRQLRKLTAPTHETQLPYGARERDASAGQPPSTASSGRMTRRASREYSSSYSAPPELLLGTKTARLNFKRAGTFRKQGASSRRDR